jgi:hypothetical protein
MKESENEEAECEGDTAVYTLSSGRQSEDSEESVDDYRHCRLADPAEREGSDRYSKLSACDVAVQVSQRTLDCAGCGITGVDHLVDAAPSDRNEGKLGSDKKRVERYQKQNDTQAGRNFTRTKVFGRTLKKGQEIHIR